MAIFLSFAPERGSDNTYSDNDCATSVPAALAEHERDAIFEMAKRQIEAHQNQLACGPYEELLVASASMFGRVLR